MPSGRGDGSGNLITGISAIGSSVGGIHSHIDGGIVFTNIDSGILPGGFSVIIDEDIAHNSEHPTLEIAVFSEFRLVVKSFESGVLHKIVGLILI